MSNNGTEGCRLCQGRLQSYGRKTILGKYPVAYSECLECGSLQTEDPTWLDEAYRSAGTGLDVGACQRCLDLTLQVSAVLKVLDVPQEKACLDYGAGMGLFARFMRDRGYSFFAYDKYRLPHYMDRYSRSLADSSWSLLTAFEVFEHLAEPRAELEAIFQAAGDVLLCTTEFWSGQGLDWWYLIPDSGQHVFFYTRAAFDWLARKYGFRYFESGMVKIFVRPAFLNEQKKMVPELEGTFRNREAMEQLAVKLFLEHQRNPYRHCQRDFASLVPGTTFLDQAVSAAPRGPLWRRILRRLKSAP